MTGQLTPYERRRLFDVALTADAIALHEALESHGLSLTSIAVAAFGRPANAEHIGRIRRFLASWSKSP